MRFVKLMLPMAVLAAPMAAQGFEGTITMDMPGVAGGMVGEARYMIKNDQVAILATAGASAGPMAGMEMRMIMDMKNAKMITLIPITGDMAAMFGGAGTTKGIKQVMDLNQAGAPAAGEKAEFKALGTSQTIAGHKCSDFQILDGSNVTNVCLASDLGTFTLPGGGLGGGRRGGGGAAPAWATLLKSHPGFPLKVWGADGKVMIQATKIEKGPVEQSMFEVPEGYMDMGGMFGGRGRGGGGN